jgi:hypothetical protein
VQAVVSCEEAAFRHTASNRPDEPLKCAMIIVDHHR